MLMIEKKVNSIIKCPHCGGSVLHNYDECKCISCARLFDEDGNILIPQVCSLKPQFDKVGHKQRQGKYRSKRIYCRHW